MIERTASYVRLYVGRLMLQWNRPPQYRCCACGDEGYGAGHCHTCWRIICYDCAKAEQKVGGIGEVWHCPSCVVFGTFRRAA